MSIRYYVGGKKEELRMGRLDPRIQSKGLVLNGKLSIEEARDLDGLKVKREPPVHGKVGNYDAVLRSHCRLDEEGLI